MTAAVLDINALTRQVTLKISVVGRRRFKVRTWLAMRIFALGGWVLGTTTTIEIEAPQ